MLESLTIMAGAPAAGGNLLTSIILPFGAMAAIMYFLLIRPQQQQRKKHQDMLANLSKGDMVVTSGGLIGKIVKLDDKEAKIDLGATEVRVYRNMIVDLYNKDAAAANSNKKEG